MPKSVKPRKKYNPKAGFMRLMSAAHCAQGKRVISKESQLRILTSNHASVMAIVRGEGTKDDWENIAAALHMAHILDEQVYGSAYKEDFDRAIDAHASCGVRFIQKGRVGYTGQELTLVNQALELHDVQVDQATLNEMERAVATCGREGEAAPRSPLLQLKIKLLQTREALPA